MIQVVGAGIIVKLDCQLDNDGRNPHDGKNSTGKPDLDFVLG
jgi:hypothetical protein